VYEGLESLRRMRLQRKEVEVLVETAEKWKPHKKPTKERLKPVEPSKRLDTWIEQSSWCLVLVLMRLTAFSPIFILP